MAKLTGFKQFGWLVAGSVMLTAAGCGSSATDASSTPPPPPPKAGSGAPARHGLQNAPPPMSAMPGAQPPLQAGSKIKGGE